MASDKKNAWSTEQMKLLNFGFEENDKDGNGELSLEEIHSILEKAGFDGGVDGARKILEALDKDRDGNVSVDEFFNAVENMPILVRQEMYLRTVFKDLDKDDSGTLSLHEVLLAMQNCDLNDEHTQQLLAELEKDGDQQLDIEEYLKALNIKKTGAVIYEVFTALDKDGEYGRVTIQEIVDALHNNKELSAFKDQFVALVDVLHNAGKNKVDYYEFMEVWKTL